MTTDQIIQEYYSNAPEDIAKKIRKHIDKLKSGANFFIIPIKKTVAKLGEYNVQVDFSCITINKEDSKETILIDSDWLLDLQNFQKNLYRHTALRLYGLDIGKDDKVKLSPLAWLNELKSFFDFCEQSKLINKEEMLSYLGFSRENNYEFIMSNGTVNLNTKEFTPRKANIKNQISIAYEPGETLTITEALKQFSNFSKEILKDNEHIFALGGFFTASIRADEIFDYYHNFPQFYIFGLRGSGKSFINDTIKEIVYTNAHRINLSKGSIFTIMDQSKETKYYTFFEEYGGASKNKKIIDDMLKSNYDRDLGMRGTTGGKNNKLGAYTNYYANDNVIYTTGESLPDNEALLTRMIIIEATKGFSHHIHPKIYKTFIEKYKLLFFNILINKKDIDVIEYLSSAEIMLDEFDIIMEERVKKNMAIIIAGRLIMGNDNKEWIKSTLYSYLSNYDTLFKTNNISQDIVNDITRYPDKYMSLKRHIEKGEKYPIFIHDNKLILSLEQIIDTYQRLSYKDIDTTKILNELKAMFGITGKISKKLINYTEFNENNGRSKRLGINYETVKSNVYLSDLWNIFLAKLINDEEHTTDYILSAEVDDKVKKSLSKHKIIETSGDSEKSEK